MSPIEKLYRGQLSTAMQRGVGFHFTLSEWVAWWEANLGPNWRQLRGRKQGQYVMARKGDKGPYAEWNVECLTVSENSSHANRGARHPQAKFTPAEIKAIRRSKESNTTLGERYGVAPRYIWGIRNRTYWKDTA